MSCSLCRAYAPCSCPCCGGDDDDSYSICKDCGGEGKHYFAINAQTTESEEVSRIEYEKLKPYQDEYEEDEWFQDHIEYCTTCNGLGVTIEDD